VILHALAFDPAKRYADAGKMATELESAMRNLAESPVDPYLGTAAIITGTEVEEEEEDDRTILAAVDDDHTLLVPPPDIDEPKPEAAPHAPPRPSAKPPKHRPRRQGRRGIGGLIVWGFVLIVLLAVILWGLEGMRDGNPPLGLAEPDTLEVESSDSVAEEMDADLVQATELNNRGVDFYEDGRYVEARALLEQAVDLWPDSWDFRRNYGLTLYQVGELEDARREIEGAIDIDPDGQLAYANLGNIHLALGDTTQAIAAYQEYLQRETAESQRLRIQTRIAEITLLGEPVPGPPLSEAPAAADTLTRLPPPTPQ
jgi:tetratricopeptide (TPR) repeat protein